jgi:hypothetical protein
MRAVRRALVVALLAGMVAVPALTEAASPRPGGYVGKTGQGRRVALLVDSGATRVIRFRISYKTTCGGGETVAARFSYTNVRIRGGRFSGRASDTSEIKGGTATSRVRLRGRFVSRSRATGTWTAKLTLHERKTRHCSVTGLRWSARR